VQTQKALGFHVRSALGQDHDRLDELLARVVTLVDAGELARARADYADFETGLRRHIRFEEELLFPLFVERSGIKTGPTLVMISEHLEIERAVDDMHRALDDGDVTRFGDGRARLESVLPGHNVKEERVLYPMIDSLITAEEGRILVAELARS
jgi:iron-sulfur cluster repair protein YtfE (RIC family)